MRKLTLLCPLLALLSLPVFATKYYRHLPFELSISRHDFLIIDYDLSEKNGIRCQGGANHFDVNFQYKGRHKSAKLPITLQSDHVPTDENEELADNIGQFIIKAKPNTPISTRYKIICDFEDPTKKL